MQRWKIPSPFLNASLFILTKNILFNQDDDENESNSSDWVLSVRGQILSILRYIVIIN